MAYDPGLAQLMRDDLDEEPGISERNMFGGLCFLLYGNMVCGVHKDGGMFRIGKEREARALEVEGVSPLSFTGRPMGGMVDISEDAIADDTRRKTLMALALDFARSLPAK